MAKRELTFEPEEWGIIARCLGYIVDTQTFSGKEGKKVTTTLQEMAKKIDDHFKWTQDKRYRKQAKIEPLVRLLTDKETWCPYCKTNTVVEKAGYLMYCTNCKQRID